MSFSVRSQILWLFVVLLVRGAHAQDSGANSDFDIGDTSVGEKGDIGSPDPLNGLEENKTPPNTAPPEAKGNPEFKDVPAAAGDSSASPAAPAANGPTNAEGAKPAPTAPAAPATPPPAAAASSVPVETISPPAQTPAPGSKRRRSRQARASEETGAGREADSPDFRRERNFHSIYQKFNLDPTPLDAWEQAVSQRNSQTYKVQRGDTLWDLSKTFFGDAHYWPKVWALNNDQVQNPHEIDTWMQIRFFPGDLNEPPTLAVTETPVAATATPSASADAPASNNSSIALPPARKHMGVLRNLPSSLPASRNPVVSKSLQIDFQGAQPQTPSVHAPAALTYYVTDSVPRAEGLVKETEVGSDTAAEYQYVFVNGVETGKVYTVIKDVGLLKDPRRPDAPPAHLVEVQGEIEVLEPANSAGLFRAMVRRNLAQVEVGSALVSGTIQTVNTTDGEPTAGPSLRIIGSEFNYDRTLVDAEGFVFLNGGAGAGLAEGQILAVHADPLIRKDESMVRTSTRTIAHVRIVKTSQHYATGFLTKVIDDVTVGDLVGSPDVASALPVPQPADEMLEEAPSGASTGSSGSGDDLSLDDEMSAPSPAPAKSAPAEGAAHGSDDDFNLDL